MPQLTWPELASMISDVIVALSALCVSTLGIIGLSQWRRELYGRRRIEITLKMLSLAKQFGELFKEGRQRFFFMSVMSRPESLKGKAETKTENEILDTRYTMFQLIQPAREMLQELRVVSGEAEFILGQDLEPFIVPFTKAYNEVAIAVEIVFKEKLDMARNPRMKSWIDADKRKEYDDLLYSPESSVLKSVEDALDELRKKLRKHIQ